MSTIQLKRGPESRRTQVTPQQGEPLVSLDTKELHIGDGTTTGGFPVGTVKTQAGINQDELAVFADTTGRLLSSISKDALLINHATKQYVQDQIVTTAPGTKVNSAIQADKALDSEKLGGKLPTEYLGTASISNSYTLSTTTTVLSTGGARNLYTSLNNKITDLETSKLEKTAIVNTLSATDATKALAAPQGKALKDLMDALDIRVVKASADATKAVNDAATANQTATASNVEASEAKQAAQSTTNTANTALTKSTTAIDTANGATTRVVDLEAKMQALEALFNNQYQVGDLFISATSASPGDRGFPGTWQLLEEELALVSTRDQGELGTIAGNNTPIVPVPYHTHTMEGVNLDSTFGTSTTGNHSHVYYTGNHSGVKDYQGAPYGSSGSTVSHSTSAAGGDHAHSVRVNFGKHTHTINNSGVENVTLDVRGKHVNVFVWKRIS